MPDSSVRRCRPLLGTFVEIAAPAGCENAVDAAFAAVAHVHARMSFHDEDSDLASLRRAMPGTKVRVAPETVAVLRVARDLHDRSGGLFDVTVGGALVRDGFLPRPPGSSPRHMTGTGADIELPDADHAICHRPSLIDLGGIAKGFAVDRAVAILADAGLESAIVNAGGDLRVIGTRKVALRSALGDLAGALLLSDAALATSGEAARVRRRAGRVTTPYRSRHAALPPVTTAVSVVAPTCVIADALTKVALADPTIASSLAEEYEATLLTEADWAMVA